MTPTEKIAAEIATLRGRIADATASLPTLEKQDNAAWKEYSKGKEIDTAAQREYDRAGFRLTAAVDTIRMAEARIKDLEDPGYEPTDTRRRTMSDDTKKTLREKKTSKVTAREQGFPDVYLGEAGNFRAGLDARAKSDLVNAALGLPADKALYQFSVAEADDLLHKRGWTSFRVKRQEAIAADEHRKATRSSEKADAAKKEAAEKKAATPVQTVSGSPEGTDAPEDGTEIVPGREFKPDPKPAPKKKSARGFGK